MISAASEKTPLLPIAEARPDAEKHSEAHNQPGHKLLEYTLLLLSVFLAALQLLVLHSFDNTPPPTLSSNFYYNRVLTKLACGLCISIPASLPLSAVLFIIAPYITRPERTVVTRYAVLLCYLAGSTLGALLI